MCTIVRSGLGSTEGRHAAAPETVNPDPRAIERPLAGWDRLSRLPPWAGYALLGGGYFVLAELGYLLLDPESGVAVWWPPSGLYLAALILAPRRRWPRVVAAMLPAALLASLLRGRTPALAAWFFAGNTLEALAGAWLVLRAAGPRPSASTVRGAFALASLPAVAAAAITLALGAAQVLAEGGQLAARLWVFWGGSSLGALVVAPLLLAFAEPPGPIRLRARRAAELAGLCAAFAVALLVAAAARGPLPWVHEVAVILPLLWAAVRFGVRGATVALAAVAVATVRLGAAGPSVASAQFLLAVLVVAVLLVAAAGEERRRATDALARSRDLLDAFFARSPTGMFIKDDRLRSVVLSRDFGALLGAPGKDVRGLTSEEAIPGAEGRALFSLERTALAGGAPVEQEVRIGDRTFLYGLFPIPRPGGGPYLGGFAVEVTGRVRAEAAVRASEERLRLIEAALDRSSDAVAVLDEEGRHVWSNAMAARILGRTQEEVAGTPVLELVAADALAWRARCEETLARGVVLTEQPLRWADGRTAPAEVASVAVEFGGRRYFVLSARDVSDRRRAEEAARLAGIGTLAAGVAHEINNPLAYILANLSWLQEQLGEGTAGAVTAEVRQVIGEAQDGALRVRDIVQHLRLFARPDETVRRVDVRAAARSAIALVQNDLRHRAALATRFADDVPPVLGNENRLAQVFLNLLTNAAQAIPAGHADREAIRIEIRAGDGGVVAEVSDTGSGIPAASRDRIFEPFFTTKPVGAGTGLGLFVCHEIVSAMGGRIEVESEPGAGSTFRVVLPAAAAEPSRATPPGAPPAAPRRARVLVLDDDERVAAALRRILARDHDVDVETDPRAALGRVRAGEAWDVVFCDLMMPDMTGMEWFEEVRAAAPALAPRVVFVTGGAFTDAAREFLERVENPKLEKPFGPADVRALVAAQLAA